MKRTPLPRSLPTGWCCWKPAPLGIDISKDSSVVFYHFSPTLCSVNSSCSGHCWAIRKVSERHSRRRLGRREVLFSADSGSKWATRQTALWWPVGKRVKDYQLPGFKKKESRKPLNISFRSHFSAKPSSSGDKETVQVKEKSQLPRRVLQSRLRCIGPCASSFYKGQMHFLLLFSTLMLLL